MQTFFTQHSDTLMAGGFAALAGSIQYWLKITEGQMFGWKEFLVHVAVSSLCGLIAFPLLQYAGLPAEVCGSLCGLAGWMGTRLIRLAEVLVRKKLGISEEDLK